VLPEERGVPEITVLELGAQGGYFGNSFLRDSHLVHVEKFIKFFFLVIPSRYPEGITRKK